MKENMKEGTKKRHQKTFFVYTGWRVPSTTFVFYVETVLFTDGVRLGDIQTHCHP